MSGSRLCPIDSDWASPNQGFRVFVNFVDLLGVTIDYDGWSHLPWEKLESCFVLPKSSGASSRLSKVSSFTELQLFEISCLLLNLNNFTNLCLILTSPDLKMKTFRFKGAISLNGTTDCGQAKFSDY